MRSCSGVIRCPTGDIQIILHSIEMGVFAPFSNIKTVTLTSPTLCIFGHLISSLGIFPKIAIFFKSYSYKGNFIIRDWTFTVGCQTHHPPTPSPPFTFDYVQTYYNSFLDPSLNISENITECFSNVAMLHKCTQINVLS